MQKIKSSWFRFWAAVLAFVGVMHSKDADAARKTVTVTCGGTQSTDQIHVTSAECKLESTTTTSISLGDGGTVQCYCDDTTLLQYQMTCSKSTTYDANSEIAYTIWSLSNTRGTCKAECTVGATRSCSTSSYTGTQTCNVFGTWNTCNKTSCKSGYLLIDDTCYPECTVDDGTGFEITIYEGSSSSSTEA